ncbi:MAG TPA: class II aldolase/adducin family protein [Firmicutes bacterium]|nr:class II aldolase/adducin family protein [Bacillota bacterium]
MARSGLVAGTWGNVSSRVSQREMVITPSGMDYFKLEPCDIVTVDLETLTPRGRWKPSVETPLHAAIYRSRPEIAAVVHTHSTYACTVAAARKEIPPILDEMVQIAGGSVKVAAYSLPGSNELVEAVLTALQGRTAALLANHGAICLGRSIQEALVTAVVVEKAAKVFILSELIGGAVPLGPKEIGIMREFFLNRYGQRLQETIE